MATKSDRSATWRARHPERAQDVQRQYRQRNRDAINAKARDRSKTEAYRKTASAKAVRRLKLIRIRIVELLGGKCARCGFDDLRALQIDHRQGGGQKEMRAAASMSTYYGSILKRVVSNPAGSPFQVLCANCNAIKRDEQRECATGRWVHQSADVEL